MMGTVIRILAPFIAGIVTSVVCTSVGFASATVRAQNILAMYGLTIGADGIAVIDEELVWNRLLLPMAERSGQIRHVTLSDPDSGSNGAGLYRDPPEVA